MFRSNSRDPFGLLSSAQELITAATKRVSQSESFSQSSNSIGMPTQSSSRTSSSGDNDEVKMPKVEVNGEAGEASGASRAANDDELIDVMNNLQGKIIASGHSLDVNLPQIAVVGAQSAGKSSVLENIVGREFLPRGKGVVTRRPILIQLFPTLGEEYGVFGHKPDLKFKDFKEIKQEIEDQMPKSSHPRDSSKAFSSIPIQLKIYAPKMLKLTLVDLPGLVKVNLDENAPDSVNEVRQMVLNHISQPECIILAVSPANQDLSTSDALEIARVVDPARERTIGVITKIDRMEPCTDARSILLNREIQLSRGYIGVINRSQQDIVAGKSIDRILEEEADFFANHPAYKDMTNQLGTPNLRKLLQRTLRSHIKNTLPTTRSQISQKLSEVEKDLGELNEKLGADGTSGKFYMLRLVYDFIEDVNVELMGNSENMKIGELSAGAIISFKLNTEVLNYLRLSLVPDPEDLTSLITSLSGIKPRLSCSSLALDAINAKLLSQYDYPLYKAVECIKLVLEDTFVKCAEVMKSYPSMKNEVVYKIKEKIKEEAVKTYNRLKEHVYAEMNYVNLEHPHLDLSVCDAVVPSVGPNKYWDCQENGGAPIEGTSSNAELMQILMRNEPVQKNVQYLMLVMTKYLEIVQTQVSDIAIKYIASFLIKKVLDFTKKDLIPTFLNSPNFDSFTEDCEKDYKLKNDLERSSSTLREALDAIQNF